VSKDKAMKNATSNIFVPSLIVLLLVFLNYHTVTGCSTFKLQKGNELIYGHNLNQGDIGVPGLIFINKSGIYKLGRTWSELTTRERLNPSSHCWISLYGSVTFNAFGRDFPDGGMNEVGLYIWEMNEDGHYPKNDSLPRLYELNWMQYILDNYSTVEGAIQCASEIEIEGPGKHFLAGDAQGNCAAIAFIDGEIVVNRDRTMPVPGLFNTPYNRELEILKYFKGFGGFYEPVLDDYKVPRFVKTAVMVRDYDPSQDAVEYAFEMLDYLKVFDIPEWSIVFDARRRNVYFKTRINPQIKRLSMDEIDFSNNREVLILNMDIAEGGYVLDQFHPYTKEEVRHFTESFLVPIVPEGYFTRGGITLDEYLERISTHTEAAASTDYQFFKGIWKSEPGETGDDSEVVLILDSRKDAIFGKISIPQEPDTWYECGHLQLIGNKLKFTFRIENRIFREGYIVEGTALIEKDTIRMDLFGIEESLGSFTLVKRD
jgi:choloylglycine hydrolase